MATATKERPIIFSGEMVRAIMRDDKTQTRRVIKCPSTTTDIRWVTDVESISYGNPYTGWVVECDAPLRLPKLCPHGKPGDRLWVREAFQLWTRGSDEYPDECEVWSDHIACAKNNRDNVSLEFRATGRSKGPWRPSIFMPRWASRILLEVVDVRVERVQDISEADAIAEGIDGHVQNYGDDAQDYWRDYSKPMAEESHSYFEGDPKSSFRTLWDSINAKRGYGWDVNPWVWVVEFKKRETSHDD